MGTFERSCGFVTRQVGASWKHFLILGVIVYFFPYFIYFLITGTSDKYSYKDYEEYDRSYSEYDEDDEDSDDVYDNYEDYDYKKEYNVGKWSKPTYKKANYGYKRRWGNYRSDKRWKKGGCSKGESYTTIIRNKICTGISEEMKCFGEPRVVYRSVGDVAKTTVAVPLCHVPSMYVKKYIEFTCSNGIGITEPVMVPTRCSYRPCTKNFWIPKWRSDRYWWTTKNPYGIKRPIDMNMFAGYKLLSKKERMSKPKTSHH